MHAFAKLVLLIVVACLCFFNACGFIVLSMIGVCAIGLHVKCIMWACGCICLQRLIGGLLSRVGGLSKLASSFMYL